MKKKTTTTTMTTLRMIAGVYEAVFGGGRRSVTSCSLIRLDPAGVCRPRTTFTFVKISKNPIHGSHSKGHSTRRAADNDSLLSRCDTRNSFVLVLQQAPSGRTW